MRRLFGVARNRYTLHRQAPGLVPEKEDSIQESLEKSAEISSIIFNAPPTLLTYAYVLAASALFGLFLQFSLAGILAGVVLLGLPAFIAGPLSAPLANALGGTLYYKRAAFLAAVSMTIVGALLVLSVPVRAFFDVPLAHVVLLGYMMATSTRHAALWATSDNRHARTLPVSFLQVLAALPLMGAALPLLDASASPLGARELLIAGALAVIFIAPLIFFLHIFDTPLKKSFRVSGSELFRYYLDHLTSGRLEGEAILNRFAEPIRAKFGVVGFRRASDSSLKAAIVVPALHPGPIGRLGGSDLPGKVAEAIPECDLVMVPHGSATHDYNPVSTADVERFGQAARDLLKGIDYKHGGSRANTAGEDIRVTAQAFGESALLTYTSWPLPIDDVEYGVGLAAESAARLGGMERAFFVDCHNSLLPGAGQVSLCTPRADAIIAAARTAAEACAKRPAGTLRVGVAQDKKTFTRDQGIGAQGVQVIATETDGQTFAYILWDGNNAVPDVTRAIGEAVKDLVDGWQVMTTDNHSVNAVAGSYGPVGYRAPPGEIAKITRLVVEQALSDLEPVRAGGASGVLEDFRVFGNQKTVQLTASINVMTSILLELAVATVTIQWLGTALLFLLLR
jgi:putative membrane protein